MKINTKSIISFIFLAFIINSSLAQQYAKEITNVILYSDPLRDTTISYNNKLLVFDFWATWCAPCIRNLEHLEKISSNMDSSAVNFYAITNETPDKIKRFKLRNFSFDLNILCDTSNINFKNFDINFIPQTFVVGQKGKILWKGSGDSLNTTLLNKLITLNKQKSKIITKKIPKESKHHSLVTNMKIKKFITFTAGPTDTSISKSYPTGKWNDNNEVFYKKRINDSLLGGISWFLNINPNTRIKITGESPLIEHIDYKYEVSKLTVTNNLEEPLMGQKYGKNFLTYMGELFNFSFFTQQEEILVYELSLDNEDRLQKTINYEESNRYGYDDNDPSKIIIINMPVKTIANLLEKNMNIPVIIHPNLKNFNNYSIDIKINSNSFEFANKSLSSIGLKLTQKNSKIQILTLNFNN